MADETLNRDIAELLGWTDIVKGDFITDGQPPYCRTRRVVPKYDADPAACLELLETVLSSGVEEHLNVHEMAQTYSGRWYCGLETMNAESVATETGDTLQEAIARACLAALKAVREEQTP